MSAEFRSGAVVEQWFRGRSRVLFVHAHPDDETISTGGTLAALAEAGREPLLITLTRGERGEVMAGPLQGLAQAHGLAVVRQNELKTALGMLGLERHAFLGVEPARAEGLPPVIYEDSGMAWGEDGRATTAADVTADALTSVPAIEVLNDLLAGAYLSGAQGIVSYDDGGGYGHPDHVLAHQLSRAVATALGLPFWEISSLDHEAAAADDVVDELAGDPNEEPLFEEHDVSAWFDRKVAALRAYATQLAVEGEEIVHVGGQRQAIDRVESFRLRLRD
ncbi:PIG-L family deacetylase [Leucobacter sp. UT-8R-CII-1-4]|uniref:PIG-L family deacetylase n=1 Tax=Leucobacter sp. UT-8R-CII-1-4 TaxID=3040075 RepID=UPI0024A9DE12|nr:PIG-L family deacetylase [Leucobacter sp. UT-8R-CII-1-4]MDI6023482.1 PIG-L family deacetylase [Leucobacter sp. UT-8R-CII-1-4]